MGLIRLKPWRGRVFVLSQESEPLEFPASRLVYRGPLLIRPEPGPAILDRGRVVGFEKADPRPMEFFLEGFGAGLDPAQAGQVLGRAAEIRLNQVLTGPLRLRGFCSLEARTRAFPGGAFFVLTGSVEEVCRCGENP